MTHDYFEFDKPTLAVLSISLIVASLITGSFKLYTLIFFIGMYILKVIKKDFFLAAFSVMIFVAQFFTPNKYYQENTIQFRDYNIGYSVNYKQGYGMNLVHILFFRTAVMYFLN